MDQLLVFLTPDGEPASMSKCVAYSYRNLYQVLARVRRTSATAIGDDVLVFLNHYLTLIGTRFMDDPQIDDLCRRIYKTHRQAIQLINERVGSPTRSVAVEVEEVVRKDGRVKIFCRSGNRVDFAPVDWMDWLPDKGIEKRLPKRWLVLRFEVKTDRLDFYIIVRGMEDKNQRRRVIDALVSKKAELGFNTPLKAPVVVKYSGKTTLSSHKDILNWKDDANPPDAAQLQKAIADTLDIRLPRLAGVRGVLKDLL